MMCILPLGAWAQTPAKLKGTWVIDAKRTVEIMKKTPQPSDAYVDLTIGFWFQGVLTFDDESVTLSAYTGANSFRYRLVPSGNGKIEYALEEPKSTDNEVLTISFLGDRNIQVKSSKPTFIELCAWQRTSEILDPKSKLKASKRALEAWKAAMHDVAQTWQFKPEPNKGTSR